MTFSISAAVIERTEATLLAAKKPQDTSLSCGSGRLREVVWADLSLMIGGS